MLSNRQTLKCAITSLGRNTWYLPKCFCIDIQRELLQSQPRPPYRPLNTSRQNKGWFRNRASLLGIGCALRRFCKYAASNCRGTCHYTITQFRNIVKPWTPRRSSTDVGALAVRSADTLFKSVLHHCPKSAEEKETSELDRGWSVHNAMTTWCL